MSTSLVAKSNWPGFILTGTAVIALLLAASPTEAQQPRATGLDVSAWQGNWSTTQWATIHRPTNQQVGGVFGDGRDFVFIRASRGGTTGEDHLRGGYPADDNTFFSLSQRYDDLYFVQNITRATAAGMFAGPYHFGRMDVIASTPNANGIPNNGTDEANHFLEMAGAWMRPGYLLPVFDFEAGAAQRTPSELAQFAIDFSDRIYAVKGIRPAVYIGNNYASPMDSIALADEVVAAYPTLWNARWPNQADPNSIPIQTADPGDYTSTIYGPWDNAPNPADPWHFWQYTSQGYLNAYSSNLDLDVAKGGREYLKDHLVPALWVTDTSGDWNDLTKWNSGQTPVAPVQAPGQLTPVGTLVLPTPRLPGADDAATGVDGQNDTVILDRGVANPTITLSSGTHDIRKLYVREALNITGGSLNVNYDNPKYAANDPLRDPASTPISAQFSEAVSLGGSASLSVYRLQVDSTQTFTLGGGSLTFNTIDLMPHGTTPAKIAVTGSVNYLPLENATATIVNGSGGGSSGLLDLGGATRTFNVADGTSNVDIAVNVPISNGGLTKTGLGTLALGSVNSYAGDTTVQAGRLSISNPYLADAADVYLSNSGTLDLGFAGNDVVRSLYLNGVSQAEGFWGAEGSGAQFTSPLITGSGLLHVTTTPPPPPPPPPPGPGNMLDHFEVDEQHFGWVYNFSPPSQTFGLAAATTIDRVVGEHEGLGAAAQQLNLVSDGSANWQIRHNSGIGSAAQPAGNVPLAPTGYVGFWLKTDDASVGTIQIAIDDPVPAGATAIEKGTPLAVIADNQWHLYQWSFENDDDWIPFNTGTNGAIDAVNGTITIDSIWITGSGNAQIYLDTVSHNANSLLAALIPGDYDRNGVVDAADYATWRAGYGQAVPPGIGADGNGDGAVDLADYVVWRRQMSMAGSGAAGNAASTPEPASLLLVAAAVLGLSLLKPRRRTLAVRP
ncbi:MAG: autotransporter-associated beta strand repeat-containing protein [Planctomycetes bacterium]|nr:autotransporter-associated beta strand repeat-containing protein [Planctomycetota bacterium]